MIKSLEKITASGEVMKVYQTGDRPVLILCEDGFHYICKFKQPGCSANKLVYELIGSEFARIWKIATPYNRLIVNDPIIWDDKGISHDLVAPLWGSRKMDSVFDLSDINYNQIKISSGSLSQFLTIALFDLWIANEDRTCNNYNLLYDMKLEEIVSIDYGGIFNSGILNGAIYQLNADDSILSSNLFERLNKASSSTIFNYIYSFYLKSVLNCARLSKDIIDNIPKEWKVDIPLFERKLNELFDKGWISDVWENFNVIITR